MERKLKVLDLFAGIGGFALGLDSTDFFETVKFVEKDKYCQKVLQKNFPNIPIEEDIKNVKGKEGDADVIVGGFPCQPMSVAGKRKGTDDDRYLWPEMFRLIREIKPQFVIGENVQGIINIQDGMVLRQVCDDLESEGFEVQCFLIPASGIGAWHQRYRVWIVAHSQHNGLLAAESRCNEEKNRNEKKDGEKNDSTRRSIGASSIRKTDNGYEGCGETSSIKETIVSNTDNIRFERDQQTTETTSRRRTEATSQSSSKDVSNTNTRLSIGENEEVQTRRDTVDSGSSRGGEENVSNTEIIGTGESRDIDQEKRNEGCSPTQSNSSSKDVSNTERNEHKHATIGKGGTDKVWRFYSEKEEKNTHDLRSKTSRCDGVSREGETDVSQSNDERRKEFDISQKSEKQIFNNRGHDEKRDISDTSSKRLQRRDLEQELQKQELRFSSNQNDETKQTWWQVESAVRGVPNGISYELDKNRANRIKTLGNAIVPQIAREFGLAIKKVLSDEDII